MSSRSFQMQVVVFYGLLALSAAAWLWWRDDPMGALLFTDRPGSGNAPRWPLHWSAQLGIGLIFGLLVVAFSQWLARVSAPVRALTEELARSLPRLTYADAAVAAACSGLAEEVFFRGAMQHAWGLWPTIGVFTVVHGFFHPRLLVWMAFAGGCGIAFGYAAMWFGTILAPLVAHIVVNYLNLLYMTRHNPA